MTVYIPLLVVLLFLSAFFSSAETAFLSLERVRLEHRAREGVAGAARVSRLLRAPGRLLAGILLGNNLANTAAAAVGTAIAAEIVSGGADVLAATLVVTVLLLLFGEVGPKTVALHHNFSLSRAYALPLTAWSRLTAPAIMALDGVSRVLLAGVGERGHERSALSLGELRTAIALGAETGALEEDESSMLLGVLTLQQTQVRRIMTPRVSMVVAEAGEPLSLIAQRMAEAGFLRLPVYAGSTDNIVGYVHVSDVSAALSSERGSLFARDVMRESTFESERAPVARVLDGMRESGSHLAILIDEHGATAGLVTLEDILEELVGQIQSESGPQAGDVDLRIGRRLYVDGRRPLSDLSAELGTDLHHQDAETVAGLVLAQLRRIPQRGEYVEHHGYRFTVMGADERRISLVALERVEGDPAADARAPEEQESD